MDSYKVVGLISVFAILLAPGCKPGEGSDNDLVSARSGPKPQEGSGIHLGLPTGNPSSANTPNASPVPTAQRGNTKSTVMPVSTPVRTTSVDPSPLAAMQGRKLKLSSTSDIELLAVCKLQDDDLICWDEKGARKPTVEQAVADNNSMRGMADGPTMQVHLNKKNRIAVFRTTSVQSANGMMTAPSVKQFGHSQNNGYYNSNLSMPMNMGSRMEPGVPVQNYVISQGSFEKKETSSNALISFDAPAPAPIEIPLKLGTSKTLDGNTIKIMSIGLSTQQNFGNSQHTWDVRLLVKCPKDKLSVSAMLHDAQQKPISFVDSEGNPASMDAYQKWQQKNQEEMQSWFKAHRGQPYRQQSQQKYTNVQCYVSQNPQSNECSVMMTINPKHVATLVVTGRYVHEKEFPDIMLDPK